MDKKLLVNVKFSNRFNEFSGSGTGKEYIFVSHDEVEVDDHVVVDTQYGLALGTVSSIAERLPRGMNIGNLKEVVVKVDLSAFNARKMKQEKLAELKAAMDKKVKELQHQAIYEMLAEKNPSLKQMLDEYKQLQGD